MAHTTLVLGEERIRMGRRRPVAGLAAHKFRSFVSLYSTMKAGIRPGGLWVGCRVVDALMIDDLAQSQGP